MVTRHQIGKIFQVDESLYSHHPVLDSVLILNEESVLLLPSIREH